MAEKFWGFGQGDVLELRLNGSPTPLAITAPLISVAKPQSAKLQKEKLQKNEGS